MKAMARRLAGMADRHLASRLPPAAQIAIKRALLRILRMVSPSNVPAWVPDEYLIRPPAEPLQENGLPEWVRTELSALAREVDSGLNPESVFSRGVPFYSTPFGRARAGDAYFRLRARIEGPVDVVVVVPWLKQGGADRGAILYAQALHEAGRRVLVMATEPHGSPWKDRLPPGVQFLECGAELARLYFDGHDAEAVIARLLVQLAPVKTYLFGSRLGWNALSRHGSSISACTAVHASLFCDEPDDDGVPMGYANTHLPSSAAWLTRVIVDHHRAVDDWVLRHGLPRSLFEVVPFPAPALVERSDAGAAATRVLWASRLDRQKCPELVAEIASRTPQFHWDVHGTTVVPGQDGAVGRLEALANVTLHGEFQRFSDIVRPDHFAFAYTSAWDGLPTVLLDAAAHRLPIVAPRLGGIPELVHDDQLVQPANDVDGYVARLHALHANPTLRQRCAADQVSAIRERSWSRFAASI